ncbi:cytochrome P450 2C21-like isoform X2 [Branchiostoma floridae x Branchiostoma belcheri]
MGMEDVVVLNGYTAVKDALVDRSELFASRPEHYMLDAMIDYGKVGARWGPDFKQRKRFATAVLKNLGMKVFSTLLQSFTFRTPEGALPPNTDGVVGLT